MDSYPLLRLALCRVSWAIGLAAGCLLLPSVNATAQNDDVNITPHIGNQSAKANVASDPLLFGSGKPIQVDVNLVLLPVTITDPWNRPVLGLEKNNF